MKRFSGRGIKRFFMVFEEDIKIWNEEIRIIMIDFFFCIVLGMLVFVFYFVYLWLRFRMILI